MDRLSGGRLVLGVGIGVMPFEWDYCGEETDLRRRDEMLDEHLNLLDRLWSGERVRNEGRHYRVAGPDWSAICYPPPPQQPRIPVWVGGSWPGSRTLRPGSAVGRRGPDENDRPWRVEDTVGVADRIRSLRTSTSPFDIALPGETDPNDTSRVDRHHEHEVAGATLVDRGGAPMALRLGRRAGLADTRNA